MRARCSLCKYSINVWWIITHALELRTKSWYSWINCVCTNWPEGANKSIKTIHFALSFSFSHNRLTFLFAQSLSLRKWTNVLRVLHTNGNYPFHRVHVSCVCFFFSGGFVSCFRSLWSCRGSGWLNNQFGKKRRQMIINSMGVPLYEKWCKSFDRYSIQNFHKRIVVAYLSLLWLW